MDQGVDIRDRTREAIGVKAMTVTGPVDADQLGVTLPHEHILIDIRNQYTEPEDRTKAETGRQKVSMKHLGSLRRNPYALWDNLVLGDVKLAVDELTSFKEARARTIIDCTPIGAGRDVPKIRDIAEQVDLNIIVGCGYYTGDTHPDGLDERTIEEIAEEMIGDFREGIDGTGIKAGIVGEIGTSSPVQEGEMRVVKAAAIASRKLDAPVTIHTYPWSDTGTEIVRTMLAVGADPKRIVICHTDVEPDASYMEILFSMGVFVEFDNFGKEFYINKADRGFAGGIFVTDLERVRLIARLLESGYESQVLITNDICLKSMLHAFGGWGYDHIVTNVVPMMTDQGISEAVINRLLVDNPARLFT